MVSAQIRGCIHFFVSVGIEDNRNKFSHQDSGTAPEPGGRNLVGPELLEGREGGTSSAPLLNACHHVPGIRVGVRRNRVSSVKRHDSLTCVDWFDLRALLSGAFVLLLF